MGEEDEGSGDCILKEVIGNATLYCGDCHEILPTLGKVDAVVTDPPYGIGMDGGNVGYKGFNDFQKKDWDTSPAEMSWINHMHYPCIVWGGNYFGLAPSRCWLIWDKGDGFKNRTFAEAELAWTNMDKNVRVFQHDPLAKGDYRGKEHPTQKPVSLMKWCISHLPDTAETILDPFMGSGTTGVAAVQMGRKFIGIELDHDYFKIACKRIEDAQRQGDLFI